MVRYRRDALAGEADSCPLVSEAPKTDNIQIQRRCATYKRSGDRFPTLKGKKMATKTQNIEVKVDERLAAEITGKAVERWHATTFSNGKRKVYVTFEEVKTVGA